MNAGDQFAAVFGRRVYQGKEKGRRLIKVGAGAQFAFYVFDAIG